MSYKSLSDTSSLPIQFGLHPISSNKISSPLRQSSASVSASTSTSTSTSIASSTTSTSTSTLSSNLSNNNETNSLKRSKNFLKFSQSNQSRIRKQSIEKETNTNESISTSSIMDHSIFGSKSISNQNRSQTIDTNRFDNDGLILPKKLINPSCIESKVKKEVHREMLWKMKKFRFNIFKFFFKSQEKKNLLIIEINFLFSIFLFLKITNFFHSFYRILIIIIIQLV